MTPLSRRQRQVLVAIAEGLTNGAAAARLGISAKTVEVHRAALCKRLGIHSIAGLTRYALREGFALQEAP